MTGRVVDEQGQPIIAHVSRAGMFTIRMHMEGGFGRFETLGVPKGRDSFLFLLTNRPEKVVVWLTAAQTAEDVDLGQVVAPAAVNDAEVEIAVTGRETVRTDMGMQDDMVTLIREDGLAVYVFRITNEGGITHSPPFRYPGPPIVQAGRYYIVPGSAYTSDSVLRSLSLIRAGQRGLLDAAGVPVIEPVSGQVTAGAIDLAAVQAMIDAIPE